MLRKYPTKLPLVSFLASLCFSLPALADCTSPAGVLADLRYNITSHVPQLCDGTNWVNAGTAGNGGAGCTSPTGVEGDRRYDSTAKIWKFCEGDVWNNMGTAGSGSGGCTSPTSSEGDMRVISSGCSNDLKSCNGTSWVTIASASGGSPVPLDFSVAGTCPGAASTIYDSSPVTVPCGYSNAAATISCVNSAGSNCKLSVNGGSFVTSASGINAGDTIVLRLKTSSTQCTYTTNTLTLGGMQAVPFSIIADNLNQCCFPEVCC